MYNHVELCLRDPHLEAATASVVKMEVHLHNEGTQKDTHIQTCVCGSDMHTNKHRHQSRSSDRKIIILSKRARIKKKKGYIFVPNNGIKL